MTQAPAWRVAPTIRHELVVMSFGAGQDSVDIFHRWRYSREFREHYACRRIVFVFADTGDEHVETYEHLGKIKTIAQREGIEFVHLTPDMGFHSPGWPSLRGFYRRTNTCGSKAFPKVCTDQLKLQPIYRWLEAFVGREYGVDVGRKKGLRQFAERHGKIGVMVGISRGEEKRVAHPEKYKPWQRASLQMLYPLIDFDADRQSCQDSIRGFGERVPVPSNCILCPWQGEIELLWMERFLPADLADWIQIEANKLAANTHMGDRNLGVWGRSTLPQALERAHAKHGRMTDAELQAYRMSHGHCVMSQY
jgi:3'-phosphoadenosine 5'-phosphosulfate sulfotransferase (PAPS reductase)/FAD synthetase